MAGRQRIDRVRRQYNQWVANQTLEDYALRFTAKSARRWSAARVANTALGAISFLALEAIGGTITLNYGVTNATAAILVVSVIIFCCGLPIAYHAANYGIDIDLLTRGAGFGYIGSTVTSLIYASFTFIFFAIEAVILATALEMCFGIPRPIGYLISAVVIIPLVIYGITLISRFQLWTQPVWIILNLLPFAAIAWANPYSFAEWRSFPGEHGDPAGHLNLAVVRHRRLGGVRAGGADRRASRLPALPAARPSHLQDVLVDRADQRRSGLDRRRRAQAAGRFVPGLLCAEPRRLGRACRGTGAYVSRSVSLCAVATGPRAGYDRHFRGPLAGQDQRHQRLCRFDRLVELLLPSHPQSSRPRGVAGVQRDGRVAVDGDRRLQGARADAWRCTPTSR